MDSFNEAWTLDDVLDESIENEQRGSEASRDACIFLLDKKLENIDLVCSACSCRVQDRLISNPKDMIGLLLFDSYQATVVIELQTPSVDVISEIENLPRQLKTKSPTKDMENCGLNEALWICSRIFSRCNQKMYSQRVLLFTDRDDPYPAAKKDPHSTDKLLRRQVLQRSKDLYDAGVKIDVIPSGNAPFCYANFYQHVMLKADDEICNFEREMNLDSMLRRIRRKDYPLRASVASGRMRLLPTDGGIEMIAPCFTLYRIVQVTGCPSKVSIDRRSNEEVVNSRRLVVRNEDGLAEPVMPSDMYYEVNVSNRKARFTQSELMPDNQKEPDLLLIGFKPIERLKTVYYIKPGYILFANDKKCYNSSRVFNALYLQCTHRGLFMLCKLRMSRGFCHLVALVPEKEFETFYVVILPFADDIRPSQAERVSGTEDTELQVPAVDAMSSIIQKLCRPFDATDIRNPVIVHFWQMLEAVALNRSIPDQDVPRISVASESDEIKDLVKRFNSIIAPPPAQKTNCEGAGTKRSYAEINESCSMAELRQFAKEKGIKLPARCKKLDAVKILQEGGRKQPET